MTDGKAKDRQQLRQNGINDNDLQFRFESAICKVHRLLHQLSKDEKTELYAAYQQATIGNVLIEKPTILDECVHVVCCYGIGNCYFSRSQWNSWTHLKGLTTNEAKQRYIGLVQQYFL